MVEKGKKKNNCNNVYSDLKDKIALLEYKPGKPLKEDRLVEEFGCSRTPIRNALLLLERDGLVRRVPKSGTYIAPVSCKDIKNLFAVRITLTKLVASLATKNVKPEEINYIERLITDMSQDKTNKKFPIKTDIDLHRKLYEATRNNFLKKTMDLNLVMTTRIWLYSIDGEKVDCNLEKDITKIIDALKNKEPQVLEGILERHAKYTIDYIKQELEYTGTTQN